jgi:hypothetical protein
MYIGKMTSVKRAPVVFGAILSLILVACRGDAPSPMAPADALFSKAGDGKIEICHLNGNDKVLSLPVSAWPDHRGHGDYALAWNVNQSTTSAGDGIHFKRITDAVAAADSTRRSHGEKVSAACRITISVAAGMYAGSFDTTSAALERYPLFVGVPDVTLRGAQDMPLDASLRATDAPAAGASLLMPDRPLSLSETYIVVADDESGYHGDGVVVEKFRFQSGYVSTSALTGGVGIGALRVHRLVVRGNHFEPTMQTGVDVRASGADVNQNYARRLGTTCGFCFAGPGNYAITGNRILDGGFVGLFLAPVIVLPNFPMTLNPTGIVVAPYAVPLPAAADTAVVSNNDISGHVRQARGFGIGIRLVTFTSKDALGTAQSGLITLSGNTLYKNNFALSVDANTPVPAPGSPAVSPAVPGNIDVSLSGNAVGPSCRNNLLVSFTRISHTLTNTTESYLANSRYSLLLGGDIAWSTAWYDHPTGYGNTLTVDAAPVANGKRTSPSDNPLGC